MARTSLPAELIADTMPPESTENGDGNDQSRGGVLTRRRRGRRAAPAGKVSGRKFQVPDTVFERLVLHAIKKRSNPSAVLTDILDRELPKHKIATEE